MNKNNLPIYFSLATIFGIAIGVLFSGGVGNGWSIAKGNTNELKIKRLLDYIERDYVDPIDTDVLLDEAIGTMLAKLDPHSVYIPKENLQQITENLEGKFAGIGVQFRMIKDSVTVIQTIKGGPSILAGIKAGDRILMANADTLYGKNISSNAIPRFLKGPKNTPVELQVYRKTNDSLFRLKITRNDVIIKSVDLAYMMNPTLGYIKLDRFSRKSYSEFKSALRTLQSKGMKALVLDLRGNGGGYVDIANSIIDEFLEDGKLIVFTKNNKGTIQESFATKKGSFEEGDLYVLIDENSASASEIVAGALQDNDKGTIIGRRSFGKGLVQVEMNLGDGSAVRLTTARYYTPTGRSIQKPYENGSKQQYDNEYRNRIKNGELLNKDSIPIVDSLQYKTPKGRIVYGGGGIVPDIFVPIDTTSFINNFYFRTITNFAFDYVDGNRKELAQKWTLESYVEDFEVTEGVYDAYLSKIRDARPSYATQKLLQNYLKAAIANELYGDVGFYRIMHSSDNMLQKVLELESIQE